MILSPLQLSMISNLMKHLMLVINEESKTHLADIVIDEFSIVDSFVKVFKSLFSVYDRRNLVVVINIISKISFHCF